MREAIRKPINWVLMKILRFWRWYGRNRGTR